MDSIYSKDVMGMVEDVCRQSDLDRQEHTPATANLREGYCRIKLIELGYTREAIDDMFAYAMGRILHEDIERALSSE